VWAKAADANPTAVKLGYQQRLARAREAVHRAFPFVENAAEKSIARDLALGEHIREARAGQIVDAGDDELS
jgi:hypothetical protein